MPSRRRHSRGQLTNILEWGQQWSIAVLPAGAFSFLNRPESVGVFKGATVSAHFFILLQSAPIESVMVLIFSEAEVGTSWDPHVNFGDNWLQFSDIISNII